MDERFRRGSAVPSRRTFLDSAGRSLIVAGGATALATVHSQQRNSSPSSPDSGAPQYQLFRVEGTHREMGRQHGEQASRQIRAHVEQIGRSRTRLQAQAARFRPLFEKYCPHLLDELTGLAEGAGISLAEALAVNIRGELPKAGTEGCTTYVIGRRGTANHEILAGKTATWGSRASTSATSCI
jgi:hypothetical protein